MVKKRRSKPRRVSVARDPKYLAFLRTIESCAACCHMGVWFLEDCGRIEAAHGPVNGLSSKGSDLEAIPLGMRHHREQHRLGWRAFCLKYSMDRNALVKYWNQRYKEMTE